MIAIKKYISFIIWGVVSVILLAAVIAANVVTSIYAPIISTYLNQPMTELINADAEGADYYPEEMTETQLRSAGTQLNEDIVAEATVLLENNMVDGRPALPLRENERNVHFFSMSSYDFITGGVGSGSIDDSSALRLNDAFDRAGFNVNNTLWQYYYSRYRYDQRSYAQERQGISSGYWLVKDTDPSGFPDNVVQSYANAGEDDVAVTVIARIGGEGSDLPDYRYWEEATGGQSQNEGNDHFLQLTTIEKNLLTEVGSRDFAKHIVIVNTSNPMELDWVDDPAYGIDAVLYLSTSGQAGLPVLSDIMTGEINPSGRLVDTWAYDAKSSPAAQNMGRHAFTNAEEYDLGDQYDNYVVYQEGIYVGYRYYETRYYDAVLGRENVGNYDYDTTVQYPFGYGLSYSEFALSGFEASREETSGDVTLSVDVTNTGSVPGKSSVQFYMSAPYIAESGVERAAVELVEFGKTDVLGAAGSDDSSETITVTVPAEYLKAYDKSGEGGYVVQGGDYYFTAAFTAHDAANNILAAKEGRTELGDASLASSFTIAEDTETYAVSTETGEAVVNRFAQADLNNIGYDIDYLTRSDWTGTFPEELELAVNDEIVSQQHQWTADDVPVDEDAEMPVTNGAAEVTAVMLMGKEFDDPLWDDLLDRMSFDEMQELIRIGGYRTSAVPSIAFNTVGDQDGPAGLSATLIGGGTTCMAYPSEAAQAATFNKELISRFGVLVGEDGLHATTTNRQIGGWYAPSVNIHRTPFSGRNYEYYSEDPVMSGIMAALVINGAHEKGIVTFLKHFAFNDQETDRNGLNVFGEEQSLREIYLRPFQIALANSDEGAATAIMSSYNRIGGTWTGAYRPLITDVLRGEWGFVGRVLSDYNGSAVCISYMSVYGGLYAGNDQWLNTNTTYYDLSDAEGNATIMNLMRRACHRILYSAVNSAGMNGISEDTRVVTIVPLWRGLLWGLTAFVAVAIVAWGALLIVLRIRKKKKTEKQPE